MGWLATHLDGVLVGLQDDIEFETLVLRPVDGLLVLGLARGHELGIFWPAGKADPRVVEDLVAECRPAAAARQDEVLGQRAVARAQSLASGVV